MINPVLGANIFAVSGGMSWGSSIVGAASGVGYLAQGEGGEAMEEFVSAGVSTLTGPGLSGLGEFTLYSREAFFGSVVGRSWLDVTLQEVEDLKAAQPFFDLLGNFLGALIGWSSD